jgi:hypothetical protein
MPKSYTLPNLYGKGTVKTNMIKILLWTAADYAIQRTLDALIL